jgi:hypothetical protein
MHAYASAAALHTLLGNLKLNGYSVNLFAHSMGNVVASEALRQEAMSTNPQKIVNTYVASQAATAASAYDPNVMLNAGNWLHTSYAFYVPPGSPGWLTPAVLAYNAALGRGVSSTVPLLDFLTATPDIYTNFPATNKAYFERIGDAVNKAYNFYNPVDGAVGDADAWPLNQAMKPDDTTPAAGLLSFFNASNQVLPLNYGYDGTSFTERWVQYNIDGTLLAQSLRGLNLSNQYDAYAAMAYAAESKSKGLGATANVGFGFKAAGQVDIAADFSVANRFDGERPDHSGQFNLDYMRRQDYWNVLVKRFGLPVFKDVTPTLGSRP